MCGYSVIIHSCSGLPEQSAVLYLRCLFTVAFGNVGEALAIVVMVIQVAGAGGTFPIETLPQVYQSLYKYLPFPYGMNAMRETIGGIYQMNYWIYVGKLAIYLVVSLVIGLLIAIPFRKLNHVIEKSKENTEIMI